VKSSATGSVANTATVTAPAGVTDAAGNNTSTDTDTISLTSDLDVLKTGPASAYKLDPISYTIVVTNGGPSDVIGASITDTIPAGLTGVSWTCTATGTGSCGAASGTGNISTTVNLPSGQKATFIVSATVSASAPSSMTNTATASAPIGTTDPGGNNSSSVTTTVKNRATQLTYTGVSSAQYSDPAYLKATLMDVTDPNNPTPISGKTITFTVGSQTFTATTADGTGPLPAGTAATGTTVPDRLNQPAGTPGVVTKFAGDNLYASASDGVPTPDSYSVLLEDATVTMITPSAVSITTTSTNVPLELTVVENTSDGYPSSDFTVAAPSGLFGLDNARPITVVAKSVTNGSTAATCPASDTTRGTVDKSTALAHCTLNNLTPDVYELTATIGGSYFKGDGIGALVVYNPALGFTTGGGWYTDPNGYRYNFGFNAKILKSGQVQGSLLTIAHTPTGIYEVKSNSMGGLVIAKDPTNTFWTATFSGKATYSIPPSQGLLWCGDRKCGDYRFTTYVEDRREPGGGYDKFWIQVLNSPTATGGFANKPVDLFYMPQPANANAVTIDNGNIQVPQPQSITK
jgi:uncharacterized repeat protein (TIGR01451 family)